MRILALVGLLVSLPSLAVAQREFCPTDGLTPCFKRLPGFYIVQVPQSWDISEISRISNGPVYPPLFDHELDCKDYIEDGRPLPPECDCDRLVVSPETCKE